MNENKIAFIICCNDELCMSECVRYINRLNVPDGMETDIIGIQGAESMCAGYNAAMADSDAKYKVYMHQDVFILNVNFIADVIEIFKQNPNCGLLGVEGTGDFVKNASYWLKWNTGTVRLCCGLEETEGKTERNERYAEAVSGVMGVTPVSAVDGMMMITQTDVRWREDMFDGFDFYDISQSMEFHRAGFDVGVARQKAAWCMHDCGRNNMLGYDRYRKIFCEEYSDFGYIYEECAINEKIRMEEELIRKNIWMVERRIEGGDAEGAYAVLEAWSKACGLNNIAARYAMICEVAKNERAYGVNMFMEGENTVAALVAKFTRYKYFLRRVELGFPLEYDEVFAEIAARADKRLIDLRTLAPHVTLAPEATIKRLEKEL
jgi:hypothetical protein